MLRKNRDKYKRIRVAYNSVEHNSFRAVRRSYALNFLEEVIWRLCQPPDIVNAHSIRWRELHRGFIGFGKPDRYPIAIHQIHPLYASVNLVNGEIEFLTEEERT